MAARKKPPPAGDGEAKSGQKPVKKPTLLATDPALTVTTSKGKSIVLTYSDLWFALVAVKDYTGNFGRLAKSLNERKGSFFLNSRAAERKRCHLRDLEKRLASAGLTAEDVVAAAGDLARTEIRRARTRVLEHTEREREWSEPMRNTPRKRRFEQALRGYSRDREFLEGVRSPQNGQEPIPLFGSWPPCSSDPLVPSDPLVLALTRRR